MNSNNLELNPNLQLAVESTPQGLKICDNWFIIEGIRLNLDECMDEYLDALNGVDINKLEDYLVFI